MQLIKSDKLFWIYLIIVNLVNHLRIFRDKLLVNQVRIGLGDMKFTGLINLIYLKYSNKVLLLIISLYRVYILSLLKSNKY